ncbi:MAG: hypothetical protein ACRDUA_10810, partial [Micromonosporaceae bacterium]
MRFSMTAPGRRTRRWGLSLAAVVAAFGLSVPAGLAAASASSPTVLATVNMEMVVLAAQVDPPKSGTGTTPGAESHVLLVEQALDAKNLLSPSYVDGHFGTSTLT